MRIGRAIIIPAILALGVAGSALTGPSIFITAAHAPSAHVHVTASSGGTITYHHGTKDTYHHG